MTPVYPINQITPKQLERILQQINEGAVFAFPTDTVYGIGANALCEDAIQRIYQIKQRPTGMPMQILVSSVKAAKELCYLNENADLLANAFWPGALTMILPPTSKGDILRRGFGGLGLRIPRQEKLWPILDKVPVASTSANLHGQPVITKEDELVKFLDGKVDFILTGGTLPAVASTVVDFASSDVKLQESVWQRLCHIFRPTAKLPVLLREGCISRAELEKILKCPLK